MIGKIKWFSEHRQYGFIIHEDKEIFIHGNEIKSGQDILLTGQQVSFDLKAAKKGMQACNVKVLEVDGNV